MALIESGRNGQGQQWTVYSPILHINDVYKSFDFASGGSTNHTGSTTKNKARLNSTHEVLAGLEMKINEGEFVTIVGTSGCGKSTLLNIIAGLDSPDSGSVIVSGTSDSSATKRIFIFQEG